MSRLARLPVAVAIALCVALSGGCGAEPEESPDAGAGATTAETSPSPDPSKTPEEPAPPPLPRCDAVWKAGKILPDPYEGCRANGKRFAAHPIICESGQFLHARGKHFWAVAGAEVQRTKGHYKDDPKYRQVYRVCTA